MTNLNELISYIVARVKDAGGPLGRTKLVKLLYLMDLEHYRRTGKLLTGLDWVFYHYGPYVMALPGILASMDLDIPEETHVTATGRKAKVFRPSYQLEPDEDRLAKKIGPVGTRIARDVLDTWGDQDLTPILDFVYFHTEPMKEAKPGERLDFTTVNRDRSIEQLRSEVQVEAGKRAEFVKRLRETPAATLTAKSALTPPPRYDSVFFRGMREAEGAERTHPGEVALDADAEEHLREPRA